MWRKKTKLALFGMVVLVAVLVALYFIRLQDFRLNRTLRTISLKLVQIEKLSQTSAVIYRIEFFNDFYRIDFLSPDDEEWTLFVQDKYSQGVFCRTTGWLFYFVRGFFKDYTQEGKTVKNPPYLIVEFFVPGTQKTKKLIFYRDKDWRILG